MIEQGLAHRYAIFYAPPPGSALDRFGRCWLGRDHRTGALEQQPRVSGIGPDRLAQLTASPRRYGFHGTLKAPFRMAPQQDRQALHAAARAFASGSSAFILPPLMLADLDGFLALVPSLKAPPLEALAAAVVRHFEPFRAGLSEAEIQRRRPERLNARQRRRLDEFGYPWIFEDFSFHLTLTERLEPSDKSVLWPALEELTRPLTRTPFIVDAIAIYEEPEPGAPFFMTARYGLTQR